ncbi:MAG TPA: EVE domain-containing protein [Planctomycetaceae bacterium]|nr:EVE domain-containing protein [Planctomycetaceae bacterium]
MSGARARPRRYWLFKSEPQAYSIHDLAAEPERTTYWDGVRNYQARNMLRDEAQVGDRVFFYHSNADPMGIFGTMEIVRAGYPDPTAFDPRDHHFDSKSDPDDPAWFMVDVRLVQVFPRPVSRDDLRDCRETAAMKVLARGSRLSIVPVTAAEWKAVHKLAGVEDV